MTLNNKRFINDTLFNENISEAEFYKNIKTFNYFNENGIVTGCPRCENCSDSFIKIDVPDPKTVKGLFEITQVKEKMRQYLEIHINKLIEIEIEKIRPEIESKIREKFTPDSSGVSKDALA